MSTATTQAKLVTRNTVPRPFCGYCRLMCSSRFITVGGAREGTDRECGVLAKPAHG